MPGLFYHFLCLMRSWGLDLAAPPMLGIYPTTLSTALLTETAPQLVAALSLYLLSYEFVYYWCGPPSTAERHPMPAPRSAPSPHPRRTLAAPSPRSLCTLAAPSLQVAPGDARGPSALQVGPQAPPPADLP